MAKNVDKDRHPTGTFSRFPDRRVISFDWREWKSAFKNVKKNIDKILSDLHSGGPNVVVTLTGVQ